MSLFCGPGIKNNINLKFLEFVEFLEMEHFRCTSLLFYPSPFFLYPQLQAFSPFLVSCFNFYSLVFIHRQATKSVLAWLDDLEKWQNCKKGLLDQLCLYSDIRYYRFKLNSFGWSSRYSIYSACKSVKTRYILQKSLKISIM